MFVHSVKMNKHIFKFFPPSRSQAILGQGLSTRRRRITAPQVVTLIAGRKRRSLLMAGDDNEMFMTRSLNVTPKTTEQRLILRSHESVAYVTDNKRLFDVLNYCHF